MELKKISLLAIGTLAVLASCTDDPQIKAEDPATEPVDGKGIVYTSSLGLSAAEIQTVRSNNDFAWNLLGELSKEDNQNVVVSPLSVSIAMTMMANGAYEGSDVQNEILDVLGYSQYKISDVNSATMKLADGIYRLDEEIDLALANSLWVDPSALKLNPAYTSILKKDFLAESFDIKEESFITDVNHWCDVKTKGMIQHILSANAGIPNMALINATYFKGLWSKDVRFDKALTADDDFYDVSNVRKQTEFMNAINWYNTRKSENMEIVTIPFGCGNYNFQIIRPNDGVSIESCRQSLTSGKWNQLMEATPTAKLLDVKLPKFDIEYSNSIKWLLADMGMEKAVNTADYFFAFPGGLEIENILHKAHFKIDEEGAEVAAVTGIMIDAIAPDDGQVAPREPEPFHLDHPFIYLITEKESGAILFIGCVKEL